MWCGRIVGFSSSFIIHLECWVLTPEMQPWGRGAWPLSLKRKPQNVGRESEALSRKRGATVESVLLRMRASEIPVACLLLTIFLRPVFPALLTSFVDERDPSPFQRVVVYNRTREVFVSARNALYHFDPNLKFLGKVSTGPAMDNASCLHPSYSCEGRRAPMPDDNRVLEIIHNPETPLLLTCGTLYQGLCHLRSLNLSGGFQPRQVGPLNETVAFTAGRASSVAFFGPGFGGQQVLWSAVSYDDRPAAYVPPAVSSKVIVRSDAGYNFEYAQNSEGQFTGVYFDAQYRRQYKVSECDFQCSDFF
ncbi:hypothetical protein AVEN_217365-1 [Araneus ventricosus]|uniref:Sema domain-containing protein n=1 Tax=Araneus ventricosus TaxID=182803 RepID=A0A4Y2S3K1_ARAVE|nr:hypothetical protein AVEN_217365-1 [Araneus ventricosus]